MRKKHLIKQTSKWSATGIFTVGVITAFGLLSYYGMLVILPLVGLGVVAFALAGFIDGQVFLDNIEKGIDYLKLIGDEGLDTLVTKALDAELTKQETYTSDWFANDYRTQKEIIKNLAPGIEKENAEKRLRRMQKYMLAKVHSRKPNDSALVQAMRHQVPALKRKILFLKLSTPLCIIAGIGFGFATAAALSATIIGTLAAASFFVWPLAVIAGIGYAFLIYHTIADFISNDKLQKWSNKIKQWFKKNEGEKTSKFVARITLTALLLTLVAALSVIATVATAGTWWVAVKAGVLLLPGVVPLAGSIISNPLVILSSIANLAFTVKNSFKSIKNIMGLFDHSHTHEAGDAAHKSSFIARKYDEIKNHRLIQTANIPGIIAKCISLPIVAIAFVGHVISVGLIGDRAPGLSYTATIGSAVIGAVSDGLVDGPYFTHSHKDKDHDHGLLVNWVLQVVLSPLLLLAIAWDYYATKTTERNFMTSLTRFFDKPILAPFLFGKAVKHYFDTEKEQRDFSVSFTKCFDIGKKENTGEDISRNFSVSSQWLQEEMALRVDKHIRLARNPEDKKALKQLISPANNSVLNLSLFKEPKERAFAEKIYKDYVARSPR
jgi:hypothetical protein